MSSHWKALFLYLLCVGGHMCQKNNGPQTAMLLAGPLTKQDKWHDLLQGSMGTDCTQSIPAGSRGYFEYLQGKGVTHFKVPLSWAQLLPTGLPSQPQPAVVRCYKALLNQLVEVGLQPLVILHGSTVPEELRRRYGGWESPELGQVFQQYAEFAFLEFGDLVQSWVTLNRLDELKSAELFQNALHAHASVQQRYHQLFPEITRFPGNWNPI
ncbi:klotho-like [Gadus macrocephalus]|uniref:klotho-like n=1 Tax=Gadus macrocephalus TaxID=80720 RepID=UPI0028CB5742|nr:klotho-like [Gadus macrocephalus]XP_059896122.1 klotho-like [Gadus macrocephalus]XP_059896123.1 klotho-like [Gadus macrocephalus]